MRAFLVLVLVASVAAAEEDGGEATGDGAAAALPSDPDAPTVGASLDRTDVLVGDRLTLTVSAVARGAVAQTVTLPSPLSLGKFEVLDSSRSDRDLGDGKHSRRFVLQIATYETGDVEVPPVNLGYVSAAGEKRAIETSAIPVRVKTLVGEDPAAKPQPLRPTRSVMVEDRRPMVALYWGVASLLTLTLALVLWRLARRRALRPRVVAPPPARPPEEVALERLRAIRLRSGRSVDGYQPFYFEVAEIVRGYLGARFSFDSLDMTTTELVEDLGHRSLEARHLISITRFLDTCDLVKFAKAPSDDERSERILADAEAIVISLRPAAVPAATTERPSVSEAARG